MGRNQVTAQEGFQTLHYQYSGYHSRTSTQSSLEVPTANSGHVASRSPPKFVVSHCFLVYTAFLAGAQYIGNDPRCWE